MGRFFFWFIVLIIVGGFVLHYNMYIPWVNTWLGKLPGDIVIKTKKAIINFPLTSAFLSSLVLTFFLSMIFKK